MGRRRQRGGFLPQLIFRGIKKASSSSFTQKGGGKRRKRKNRRQKGGWYIPLSGSTNMRKMW